MITKIKPRTYLQVPLCLLAFGESADKRLNALITFGTVECGLSMWAKLAPATRAERLAGWKQHKRLSGADADNPLLIALLEGSAVIGITFQNLSAVVEQYKRLSEFVHAWEQRNGRDPLVRLRRDLVFDARDGDGITPRLLWVFTAMLSVIGNKAFPVRISRDTIALRCQGYRSVKVRNAEIHNRVDASSPPTEWQTRADIDELVLRRLVVRATYARRHSFYSSRMTLAKLTNAVRELKTSKVRKLTDQYLNDLSLTQNIRNTRAQQRGKPLPYPNALPMDELKNPFTAGEAP